LNIVLSLIIAQKRVPKIGYLTSWGTQVVLEWPYGSPGAGLCPAPRPPEGHLSTTIVPHELRHPTLGTMFFSAMIHVAALWMAVKFEILQGSEIAILGVWAAPGAPETLAKGGGRSSTFWKGLWGPRGRPSQLRRDDHRRAQDRWISDGGSVPKHTLAVGDNPRVLPVSLRFRSKSSSVVLLN
jgi:hypothetical protein